MLPEHWQTINRLLVLCQVAVEDDAEDELMQRNPALRMLHQALSNVDITLLAFNPEKESFLELVEVLSDRAFDAAIIFTLPNQSPYSLAYLCYLAGIPIRLGQSNEFGGGVLSTWIKPPIDPVAPEHYHLHLLKSVGVTN